MAKKEDKGIYVRIPYTGFIPPINKTGPLKCFLSKNDIIALIQTRYDVRILNPSSCPEFAEQLISYHAAIKASEYAKAQETIKRMGLYNNPISEVIRNADAANGSITPNKSGGGMSNEIEKVLSNIDNNTGNTQNIPDKTKEELDLEAQYQNDINNIADENSDLPVSNGNVPDMLLPNAVIEQSEEQAAIPPDIYDDDFTEDDIYPAKQ